MKFLFVLLVFMSFGFLSGQKFPDSFREEVMSRCAGGKTSEKVCSCLLDIAEVFLTPYELTLAATESQGVSPEVFGIYLTVIDVCVSDDPNRKFPKTLIDEFFVGCKNVLPVKACRCHIAIAQRFLFTDEWVGYLFGRKTRKSQMVWDYAVSQCGDI